MNQYPVTAPVKKGKGVTEYKIGTIADLDQFATVEDEEGETIWKSYLATGTLVYDEINRSVTIDMPENSGISLESKYSRGGRGMELSDLISCDGKLYTVGDKTGIVFEIKDEKSVPQFILSDGDGNQTSGFKGEWMTVKDGILYVGGHGREFVLDDGSIRHKNYMWVKLISKEGTVQHVDWCENYDALRVAAGCPFPGYMIHEAAIWSQIQNKWFFLPRKVSKEQYDHVLDEQRAGNILLSCSETFDDIQIVEIGELHKTRGYSSFKFIPGTDDTVIVAVKSEEIGKSQKSFITVFTTEGEILLEDQEFSDKKYEGIEFL